MHKINLSSHISLLFILLFFSQKNMFAQRNEPLGNVIQTTENDEGFTTKIQNANLRVRVFSPHIIQIQLTKNQNFDDFSYAVIEKPQKTKFSFEENNTEIILKTDEITLKIQKSPARISFLTKNNKILNEDDFGFGTSWLGEEVTTYKKLQEGERFIGLGEKTGNLDRRGSAYTNWNNDDFGYKTNADPLYVSTPFYMGLHHNLAYGIYMDNTAKSHFNFGASNDRFSSFGAENGDMNYYFMHHKDVQEIVKLYTNLTGKMPLPPLWGLGYQQCRWSYTPDTKVINVAKTFREKQIPADVLYLDIDYMQDYKVFTWHKTNFSQPKKMLAELKNMGFKTVTIIDPGVKVEKDYGVYESGKKEDIFVKYPDNTYYTGQVWPGWCHFPDFTMPKARNWWGKQFEGLINDGVNGFWNDMNEIATWGNTLPNLMDFDFEGKKATTRQARNIYGMQMARATYEGTKTRLGKRPLVLTRAGFSGVQRYSAVWTGDNRAEEDHMLAGIRLVNSMGITGLSYVGYDVGGFTGNPTNNLYARWITLGAFTPFFRGHTAINTRPSEPWAFGEDVENIAKNYIQLRYRLLPYIYSHFYESSQNGLPVQRSLTLTNPFESKIYDTRFQNQYLFGQDLLVIPSESTKEFTETYLPTSAGWYDLYEDTYFTSGQEIISKSPLNRLPIYVRAGAILPMQSVVQNTQEKPSEVMDLHIYFGENGNKLVYYEDNGEDYNYEKGDKLERLFEFLPSEKKIVLHESKGSFKSKFTQTRLILHGFEQIKSIKVNGKETSFQKSAWSWLPNLQWGTQIQEVKMTNFPLEKGKITVEWGY